jgi:hypothetical protein
MNDASKEGCETKMCDSQKSCPSKCVTNILGGGCCCSSLLTLLGFLSIIGSVCIWALTSGNTVEAKAHAERFGIFVGLWAPSFFALAGVINSRGCCKNSSGYNKIG